MGSVFLWEIKLAEIACFVEHLERQYKIVPVLMIDLGGGVILKLKQSNIKTY